MNLIIYVLTFPFVWGLSILPFRVLYFISDIIYFILFNLIGYRKKVVLDNLKLVFPNKDLAELLEIRKKFYSHFIDVFIEMIKTFTVSKEEIYKRYTFTNIDFLNELHKDGKSMILVGPHYANWEWIMSLDSFVDYKGYAAFTLINNKYFNNQILKSRAQFGTHLIATKDVFTEMKKNDKHNIQAAYGLLSDQSPQLNKTFYWTHFFGVEVPVHTGAEMLAKKYHMNMVYIDTVKLKRGHYETTFSLLSNDSTTQSEYPLTDQFLQKVETRVRIQPEYYLWTHRRFKHKDKNPLKNKKGSQL